MSNPTFQPESQLYFDQFREIFSPDICKPGISSDFIFTLKQNADFLDYIGSCIDFNAIIPYEFKTDYYRQVGRPREYSLESMLRACVLEKYLGFTDNKQFLTVLKNSPDLRGFCRFHKVPDESVYSRFKKNFKGHLHSVLTRIVDITRPMSLELNPYDARSLIIDTTGIEPYVHENNPKIMMAAIKMAETKLNYLQSTNQNRLADRINRKLTDWIRAGRSAKDFTVTAQDLSLPKYSLSSLILSCLPKESQGAENCRLQYINGHLGYPYKFGLLTDGFGLPVYVLRLNHEELQNIDPDLPVDVEKKKSVGDSTALFPMLADFFDKHPEFQESRLGFERFLGDAAYDSYDNFSGLHNNYGFEKVFIPINPRNTKELKEVPVSAGGIPLCPEDRTLEFKHSGICHEKGRSDRTKWVCPKRHMVKGKMVIDCQHPCSNAKSGRSVYTAFDQGFRAHPGVDRNSREYEENYKKRAAIERTINTVKTTMAASGHKTQDPDTIEFDLVMSAIVTHLCFIAAVKLNTKIQY